MTRTYSPKHADVKRDWVGIDATDVVLGRLASHAATILRGKNKATFTPHMDMGDWVIITNAEKGAVTGPKLAQKKADRHSGYPGGLRATTYAELLEKNPERAVEKAIRGMLPKTALGRDQFGKMKVYSGTEPTHAAPQPRAYTPTTDATATHTRPTTQASSTITPPTTLAQ